MHSQVNLIFSLSRTIYTMNTKGGVLLNPVEIKYLIYTPTYINYQNNIELNNLYPAAVLPKQHLSSIF